MIVHIFTLFWNQKRKYGGMFVEQVVVFIVLLFCFVNSGKTLSRYYTPGMLDTENVLCFGTESKLDGDSLTPEETEKMMRGLCERLRKHSVVETVSECAFFVPYVRPEGMNPKDSLGYGEKRIQIYVKGADEYTAELFKIEMEEGEWLSNGMLENGTYSAVITRQLSEQFGWHEILGRCISLNGRVYTIVGVIAGLKQEAREESHPVLILPYEECGYAGWPEFVVRVQEGKEKTFSKLLDREFARLFMGTNQEISLFSLKSLKVTTMLSDIVNMGAMIIPVLFLLVFTFIGTFGLFWLYSSKRRKEFALRIVVGATPRELYRFVVSESLLLSVLALLPGMVLFCFVYPFDPVHLSALGCACLVMILFSVFSAWWPAYKVARVNPVEAMREV